MLVDNTIHWNYDNATHNFNSNNKYPRWQFSLLFLIPLGTIWGNVLVCLAVYLERRLRHRFNMFLVSLAVSDLLCALFVMPVSAWHMTMGQNENDQTLCLVWYSTDIFFTATTIIHLCNISLDRYLALRRPFGSIRKQNHKLLHSLSTRIVMSWLIPFCIAGPLFYFALKRNRHHRHHQQQQRNKPIPLSDQSTSSLQFHPSSRMHIQQESNSTQLEEASYKGCGPNDLGFTFIAIGVTFVLPLIIMIVTYFLTVKTLSKHMKQIQHMQLCTIRKMCTKVHHNMPLSNAHHHHHHHHHRHQSKTFNCPKVMINDTVLDKSKLSKSSSSSPPLTRNVGDGLHHGKNNTNSISLKTHESKMTQPATKLKRLFSCRTKANWYESRQPDIDMSTSSQRIEHIHKGKRAVRVIGVLFAMFVTCYTPFFIVYIVDVLCVTCTEWTNPTMSYLEWLGYLNSMLNPFVYHVFNPIFRRTFRRLLRCTYFQSGNRQVHSCFASPKYENYATWRSRIKL